MRMIAALVLMSLGCLSALAVPANLIGQTNLIGQKGHVFSVTAISVKKGESLQFFNDDNVPHNIMSATPGNQFNLGSQAPGSLTPVSFDQIGDVKVICAIHPRMKMTVTVYD